LGAIWSPLGSALLVIVRLSFIPSFRAYQVATPSVLQLHPIFQGSVVLDRLLFRGEAFAPPIPGRYSVCCPASSHLSGGLSLGHNTFSWWAFSPHSYRVATPPVLQLVKHGSQTHCRVVERPRPFPLVAPSRVAVNTTVATSQSFNKAVFSAITKTQRDLVIIVTGIRFEKHTKRLNWDVCPSASRPLTSHSLRWWQRSKRKKRGVTPQDRCQQSCPLRLRTRSKQVKLYSNRVRW
jgi:hypothetical protein